MLASSSGTKDDTIREKLVMGIDSHATLWDLRKQIGEEAVKRSMDGGKTYDFHPAPGSPEGAEPQKPVHPATIRIVLSRSAKDLPDRSNGCTLRELDFKSNETISAFKKSALRLRRAALIEDDEANDRAVLTSRARVVVGQIFEHFSVVNADGVRVVDLAKGIEYTKTCTGEDSNEEDPRVARFFSKYGIEGTNEVTREAFEQFFVDACLSDKDETLRDNLRRLGYAQDLSKIPVDGDPDQVMQLRKDKEEMPRYKIAKNEAQFDILMSLLDGHSEVARVTQELI